MREIKFRAWDNKNKIMINDIMDASNGELFGKNFVYLQFDYSMYIEDLIVEQYTCLKDKNGVEIYEGDRIRYTDGYLDKEGNGVWNEMVIETIFDIYVLQPYIFEVIGNIHEDETK